MTDPRNPKIPINPGHRQSLEEAVINLRGRFQEVRTLQVPAPIAAKVQPLTECLDQAEVVILQLYDRLADLQRRVQALEGDDAA